MPLRKSVFNQISNQLPLEIRMQVDLRFLNAKHDAINRGHCGGHHDDLVDAGAEVLKRQGSIPDCHEQLAARVRQL
jgi:hypothetical protein